MADWKGAPPVVVYQSESDLPSELQDEIAQANAQGSTRGVYYNGKVHLVADAIRTEADVETVLFHEALGHYGVDKLFGPHVRVALNRLYIQLGGTRKIKAMAKDFGIDLSAYTDNAGHLSEPERREMMVHELIAHLAERNIQPSLVNKVITAIKQALRRLGFRRLAGFGKTDIINIVAAARDSVINQPGVAEGSGDVRLMVGDQDSYQAAIAKGLPMDTASRMERALDQGFVYDLNTLIKEAADEQGVSESLEGVENDPRPARSTEAAAAPQRLYHGTVDDISGFAVGHRNRKDNGWLGNGIYLTDQPGMANSYANTKSGDADPNVMPVFARIENPYIATLEEKRRLQNASSEQIQAFTDELIRKGHDSAVLNFKDVKEIVVFDPARIRSINAAFDPDNAESGNILFSRTPTNNNSAFDDLDSDQESFLGKIAPPTAKQRIKDRITEVMDRAMLKTRQGLVDRFAALRELDEKARGENVVEEDTANSSWVLARMSAAADGALNALMNHGRIRMDDSVIDVDIESQGLLDVLKELGGSAEIERFMGWIAANRSNKLMQEGRENLFEPNEIAAGMRLNQGNTEDGRSRSQLYAQTFDKFQAIRDDVLAIAEEAGIISEESRSMWRDEFYVPFYRVMEEEDGVKGPRPTGGISRQEAYKKLKGGSQNLNDLLGNTLMNFHHLLSASLKNQAARKAVENAEAANIAVPTSENARDKKASTFVLIDGAKQWYNIGDPLVFEALSSLGDTGMNSTAMRLMRSFKRVFTNFVTASLQFMAANLIRDSFQAVALADMKVNPITNAVRGANAYGVWDKKKPQRAHMQATGGAFSFGHVYGEDADAIKSEIDRELRGARVIRSKSDVKRALLAGWDWYHGFSDSFENANRAAIYEQQLAKGKTNLQAAFAARDLMDFSAHGAWPATRFLIGVVPFLNARLQGLDKIYRSGVKPTASVIRSVFPGADPASDTDKKAALRFNAVTGALTLATMALYLANYDDDEYKKLEDWQRDSYWFIRMGDKAFFIPKPFEVGAIATLAERSLEQAIDDKATGKLFADRLGHMLMDTFSFDPTPQMFAPLIDLYANKDSFTGRQIETMGQQRLSPSQRVNNNTTEAAKWASSLTENTFGAVFGKDSKLVLSPVQVDYLVGGYLGWLGERAMATTDVIAHGLMGKENPDKAWSEYQPFRRFYRDLNLPGYTRYQTDFYNDLREVNRVYADIQNLRKIGEHEEAMALAKENRDKLAHRKALNGIQKRLSRINAQMKVVRNSSMSGEEKRRRLDLLMVQKNKLTAIGAQRLD